jgi:hypothetical protein
MAEMMVQDYPRSLGFWTGPMGFAVAFTVLRRNWPALPIPTARRS